MKSVLKGLIATAVVFSAGTASASGLTRTTTIDEAFLANSITMQNFFAKKLEVRQGEDDLREDIYEFHAKSPLKAFALSLAIPGAGQFYNGSKIKAGTFLAADALLWTGYLIYHGKGNDQEKKYRKFADDNYTASRYFDWFETLGDSVRQVFSHQIYPDPNDPEGVVRNHEYYENIGKYDQFQPGWNDYDSLGWPPPPLPGENREYQATPYRMQYLDMRRQANDYFSNASTMAMISIANHLISAFDAAIGAKKYNRGTRQYSLRLKSKNIDGKVAPFIVAEVKF
ncbi:MAG: hypothetical protein A2W25_07965 [candidate division Zixibacteria bacterium RBG_16_53_22]|nr:MAG: hypothetical protein A2W25_07965 [candidate division Zixibacteria bacterium RBG_16_53_22]